ncbi:MAG: ComEC/Rec2 family competence protein [Patescibacteria group bacterium]
MSRLFLLGIGAFALGVAMQSLYPVSLPLIAFAALAGMVLIFFARTDWSMGVGVVLVLCALGVGRVAFMPSSPPPVFLPLFDTKVELLGVVVGDPDIRETTQRVTVEVAHEDARMRVLVVASLYPELAHGEGVAVIGKLEHPEPFDTDGGRVFRYDTFLAKDGVFGIVSYANVEVVSKPSTLDTFRSSLYAVKHWFTRGLEYALPEPYAALAAGIITGGKQGLGKELLDAFTTAGLIHIVVLSGYNVMIVAEAVLRMCGFLKKRSAAVVAGIVIALFVMAAGAGAASIRAGVMAGVALFARASGRTYDALRALLFVFVAMLLINPLLLIHDPGFQFSFAATLGLILAAPSIEARFARVRPAFVRDIAATTIAAQLFVLPLLLYQTGNLSFIAFPANILALPVVPLAMLFSAIAGVAGILVPFIAPVIAVPALLLLAYLIELAQIAASLPYATSVVPVFPFILVPVMYAGLAGLIYLLKRSG